MYIVLHHGKQFNELLTLGSKCAFDVHYLDLDFQPQEGVESSSALLHNTIKPVIDCVRDHQKAINGHFKVKSDPLTKGPQQKKQVTVSIVWPGPGHHGQLPARCGVCERG